MFSKTSQYFLFVQLRSLDFFPTVCWLCLDSGTSEEHGLYVWNKLIKKSKVATVLVVAHSWGGVVTAHLAEKTDDFTDRVKAVALTDSVHALRHMDASKDVRKNRTYLYCRSTVISLTIQILFVNIMKEIMNPQRSQNIFFFLVC